jgi:hypothetical protein
MAAATWRALGHLNSLLTRFGLEILPSDVVYDWQRLSSSLGGLPPSDGAALPAGAADYLRPDNPRLRELSLRYENFDSRVTAPIMWVDDHVRPQDMLTFRADNAYVWQRRGPNMNETAYALTEFYIRSIDTLGLLEKLSEDGLFGVSTFVLNAKEISRDLLDSILEMYFLDRHLGLFSRQDFNVLDIGAGYGRLAHRMTTAVPGLNAYLCTDGVAVSSFICEYYLSFRELSDRAKVVPLDEVESAIEVRPMDLAINIHSFSECTFAAIDWWLSLLERRGIRYLMVIPHRGSDHKAELISGDGKDYAPAIERHGYRLVAKDPKYGDPVVQNYAINPTFYYLFENQVAPDSGL